MIPEPEEQDALEDRLLPARGSNAELTIAKMDKSIEQRSEHGAKGKGDQKLPLHFQWQSPQFRDKDVRGHEMSVRPNSLTIKTEETGKKQVGEFLDAQH